MSALAPVDTCSSCRGPIVWTERSGERVAVEPVADPAGNVVVSRFADLLFSSVVRGPRLDAIRAGGVPVYLEHRVGCAGSSRRKAGK